MAKIITPIGKRVLISPLEIKEVNVGGLILSAESVNANTYEGMVLAVGSEVTMVKKGDHVVHLKYGLDEIEGDDRKKFMLVEEQTIIAVIDDK